MTRLFIYGTLAPGKPNEHILKDIVGTWEEAKIKGSLKEDGWGSAMGYNGLVLDGSDNEVKGLIFSSNYLDDAFAMLDEFEGEDYCRVVVKATLSNDGQEVDTFVYALAK